MKRIWMRVGMDVELTDEDYEALIKANNDGNYIRLERLFSRMIATGAPSGETYILGKNDCNLDDYYDNPDEEISVLF